MLETFGESGATFRDKVDRRTALGLMAGAAYGAAALASRPAEAQMPPGAARPPYIRAAKIEAKLVRVAPNVYAFTQMPGAGQPGRAVANCGLIVGPKGLTAVDTTAAPVQATNFIREAARVSDKPFKRAILTHQHFDHIFGLQFFGAVDVVAQENCRSGMISDPNLRQGLKDLWSPLPGWADGTEKFQQVLPDVTYRDRISFYDGDSELRVMHFGLGHTSGDSIVFLPKEKVVFAGDLAFFKLLPLDASGYVADWIKSCDAILALDVDVIVPGHGPIGTKADLADARDYLNTLYTEGKKLYDAGVPVEEAAKRIDVGRFATWPEADRTGISLHRLYMEYSGALDRPPGAAQAGVGARPKP